VHKFIFRVAVFENTATLKYFSQVLKASYSGKPSILVPWQCSMKERDGVWKKGDGVTTKSAKMRFTDMHFSGFETS
jgi:hypothetical protein